MRLEVSTVNAGDVELGYSEIGKGRPLILMMGLWGVMDLWDDWFVRRLADGFRVIAHDNRGMGFSEDPGGEMSIEILAEDAAEFAKALGLEKASFLGWSMGANVALELGLRHPDLVDHLVVYAGSCGGSECKPPDPCIGRLIMDPRTTYEGLIKSMFPAEWNAKHPDIWEYYPRIRKKSHQEVMDRQLEAEKKWRGCHDRLQHMKCRTLIVNGTEDLDVPAENAVILAGRIRGSWMVQFEHAGHGLMYQFPERLANCVSAFLDDAEPPLGGKV